MCSISVYSISATSFDWRVRATPTSKNCQKTTAYHFVSHHQLSHSVVRHVESFFQSHLNLTVIPCTTFRPVLVTLALERKKKKDDCVTRREINVKLLVTPSFMLLWTTKIQD